MSGLFSDGIGFFSSGGSSGGSGGAGNFTSITTNTPSVAGNEVLETWGVTGDAVSNLTLKNSSGLASAFAAWLSAVAIGSANSALTVFGDGQTDTGGAPIFQFNALSSGGQVTVRPLYDVRNNGVSKFKIAADGSTTQTGPSVINMTAIAGSETLQSWAVSDDVVASLKIKNGTSGAGAFLPFLVATGSTTLQALAFSCVGTTDTGTSPIIQFNTNIGAGAVVVRPSFDVQNNGVSQLNIAGNGTVTQANGQAVKSSTRLTTPVTVGLTDYIVGSNLTTPGPVSMVLPTAAGNAGRIFTVKDEKGDAATNNITLSVTGGGNINGAATFVIANAYGGANVYSNGTQWFTH